MLCAALSTGVAFACIVASARRLAIAVAPTPLDPALLGRGLAGHAQASAEEHRHIDRASLDRASLARALRGDPALAWEEALLGAQFESHGPVREALTGELLTELEGLSSRWAAVPRVCASLATSAAFLLAVVALLGGLPGPDAQGPLPTDLLRGALDTFAPGLVGTSFCVAVHGRARRAVASRWASVDVLLAALRTSADEARPSSV